MTEVPQRIALVTGASSGIGAAVALTLAKAGFNVTVGYHLNSAGAEQVVRRCRDAGVDALSIAGDVADDGHCRKLVDLTLETWGRLDCVVNNAGITRFANAGNLNALRFEDFTEIYAVNVIGAYQVTRASEPALRIARGAVVNVSSHSAFSGFGSSAAYAASKGALNTLTLALAREMAPEVTVNAVCPGFVDTTWMAPKYAPHELHEFKMRVASTAPLKRLVTPEEVAEAVGWFSLGGRSITGQLLTIDGGHHLNAGNVLGHV